MSSPEERVRGLVHRACQHLDAEQWEAFMALCAPAFRYRITAYSPDLRKQMIWFDHDHDSLKALLEMVPQHLRRLGTLLRHVSVGVIEIDGNTATATSTFQCIHTDHDGRSRLMCVGRYVDRIDLAKGLLTFRETQLETRDLGIGSHVPI
jgi:methanesulfonate monooxygenase small subunit